jgi:hypothetical protein
VGIAGSFNFFFNRKVTAHRFIEQL